MKRFSIGLLMAIIFLIAIDVAILKWLWTIPGSAVALGMITLPMINLLLLVARRTWGDPNVRRFWLGFQAAGWAMVVLFANFTWFYPFTFLYPASWLGDRMGPGPLSLGVLVFLFVSLVAFYTIPQLLVATAGGLLASGYRVGLVFHRPRAPAIDRSPQPSRAGQEP